MARRRERGDAGGSVTRGCMLQRQFREDLRYWVETDPRLARRIMALMEAVLRDPFRGIGKPEPMRQLGPDVWSRRITEEHRLVYLVQRDRVDFLQARYHYQP